MSLKKNSLCLSCLAFLLVASFFLTISGCASKPENGVVGAVDTAFVDTVATEGYDVAEANEEYSEEGEGSGEAGVDFIHYNGALEDNTKQALRTFSPFISVQTLAQQFLQKQDSLVGYGQTATEPRDTMVLHPFKDKAYRAIINYKKQMMSGLALRERCPSLLELTRVAEANDSSQNLLPKAEPSDLLSKGNFFFIGAAPFIWHVSPEENKIFTDPQGKPETRFTMSNSENEGYLLPSVYGAKPGPIDIGYGPPIYISEGGGGGIQEVHGIGSLVHRFVQRVPVFFITPKGLLPARLVSVQVNLFEGWSSSITFGYGDVLEANEILAVYIPYGPAPTSYTFNRLSDMVWTVDLNNDSVADFACVYNSHAGEISEVIMEVVWFVNINGTWQIIDHAQEYEST